MNELPTWPLLATYSGAVTATTLLTQLLKDIPLFRDLPTRALSYAVALAVLLAAFFFTGRLTLANAVLCLVNAAIVSMASNGTFEALALKRSCPTNKKCPGT